MAESREIPLTRGKVALVDEADFARLDEWKWHVHEGPDERYIYAGRRRRKGEGPRGVVLMHRVILGAPAGLVVDHINGDGLDNRRANLRLASIADNAHNQRLARNNTLGVKGVWRGRRPDRWHATIHVHGRALWLGLHRSLEEAARAYDRAAREHFGEFARTNFPQ